jgi:hypothetical protein
MIGSGARSERSSNYWFLIYFKKFIEIYLFVKIQ